MYTFDGSGRRKNKLNTLTNNERQKQKWQVHIRTIVINKAFWIAHCKKQTYPHNYQVSMTMLDNFRWQAAGHSNA